MKKMNKKGFTLIEVVLVLAIGGLIFLLAFIAYQQVSRNRKDTQRRNDAGRVLAQLQSASGDGLKITTQGALDTFKTSNFNDLATPGGATYNWLYRTAPAVDATTTVAVAKDTIYVSTGSKCSASNPLSLVGATGSMAVIFMLENGTSAICRSE